MVVFALLTDADRRLLLKEHTALEFSDNVIVINSFSKYFCMPGFRVGWMILPEDEDLVRKAEIIVQNIFIAANTPAQYAAVEAFDEEYLEQVRDTFRQRRDFLYDELKNILTIDAVPDRFRCRFFFPLYQAILRYQNHPEKSIQPCGPNHHLYLP